MIKPDVGLGVVGTKTQTTFEPVFFVLRPKTLMFEMPNCKHLFLGILSKELF